MIKWDDEGDNSLHLFTPSEFETLPNGVELESISGDFAAKGKDYIDMDTRFGHIAWGVRNPLNHKDKHVVLLTVLKSQHNNNNDVGANSAKVV